MRVYFLLLLSMSFAHLFSSCSPAKMYYKPLVQRPGGNWEGSSSSWGGYTEQSVGRKKVKVTFETFNNPGPAFADYFVKVRAAEIALAKGHRLFWMDKKRTKVWSQQSYFQGYVVPGYMETRRTVVSHCNRHCKKHCHAHDEIIYEEYWVPDRYVPPHTSVNRLSKAELIMSTSPSRGRRVDATSIIAHALSGANGFGKPQLSQQTIQAYKALMTSRN